jgi:hypothetical protein
MKTKNCPLCHEQVYSNIGTGCRLCGMPLEDKGKEFCSSICRDKFREIKRK